MLVTTKNLLKKAQKERYAVPHFNTSNLEITKAIISAANKLNSPIILGTSEGEAEYLGPKYIAAIAKAASEEVEIPIALHLDHGKSLEFALKCLKSGYSSIHIDGSDLPFEKNVELTSKVTKAAHKVGIPVEGELGHVAGHSILHKEEIKTATYETLLTNPTRALKFVKMTGIDSLAVSIGTAHGIYKQEPRLDFNRLEKIRNLTKIPLVLHGGSGIPKADIKKAIKLGICKININTELRLAFTQSLKEFFTKNPDEIVPYNIFPDVIEAVEKVVVEKIRLFGSANKT